MANAAAIATPMAAAALPMPFPGVARLTQSSATQRRAPQRLGRSSRPPRHCWLCASLLLRRCRRDCIGNPVERTCREYFCFVRCLSLLSRQLTSTIETHHILFIESRLPVRLFLPTIPLNFNILMNHAIRNWSFNQPA